MSENFAGVALTVGEVSFQNSWLLVESAMRGIGRQWTLSASNHPSAESALSVESAHDSDVSPSWLLSEGSCEGRLSEVTG